MNIITVQCKRANSTHARIGVKDKHAIVVFGEFLNGEFITKNGEGLLFEQHPEITNIHDGDGWNLDVLNALVANYGCGDEA